MQSTACSFSTGDLVGSSAASLLLDALKDAYVDQHETQVCSCGRTQVGLLGPENGSAMFCSSAGIRYLGDLACNQSISRAWGAIRDSVAYSMSRHACPSLADLKRILESHSRHWMLSSNISVVTVIGPAGYLQVRTNK